MGTAVTLAALSALVWGSADYCGARAARRTSALTAAFGAAVAGVPVVLLFVLFVPGTPHPGDLAWGAAAGVAGLGGLALLYRGLASGAMAVVAPVTGVTGAALPVVFGLVTSGVPSVVTLAGVVCAVTAIGLVSLGPAGEGRPAERSGSARSGARLRSVGTALAAGALFGLFFVLLDQTAHDSGLWPVVAVRAGAIGVGLPFLLVRRLPVVPARGTRGWVLLAGTGDILANILYLTAVRDGVLTVVAPVAALYPVSTVLLALAVDREQVRPIQVGGLALAATALVLTAL
jgi:drug/metabolite transporter (DMT)-like permease